MCSLGLSGGILCGLRAKHRTAPNETIMCTADCAGGNHDHWLGRNGDAEAIGIFSLGSQKQRANRCLAVFGCLYGRLWCVNCMRVCLVFDVSRPRAGISKQQVCFKKRIDEWTECKQWRGGIALSMLSRTGRQRKFVGKFSVLDWLESPVNLSHSSLYIVRQFFKIHTSNVDTSVPFSSSVHNTVQPKVYPPSGSGKCVNNILFSGKPVAFRTEGYIGSCQLGRNTRRPHFVHCSIATHTFAADTEHFDCERTFEHGSQSDLIPHHFYYRLKTSRVTSLPLLRSLSAQFDSIRWMTTIAASSEPIEQVRLEPKCFTFIFLLVPLASRRIGSHKSIAMWCHFSDDYFAMTWQCPWMKNSHM